MTNIKYLLTLEVNKQEMELLSSYNKVVNLTTIQEFDDDMLNSLINVSKHVYGVGIEELTGKCRKRDILDVLSIIFYIIRDKTDLSLAKIGKLFNRNHATVIHNINKCKSLIDIDLQFKEKYLTILSALN